MNYSDSIKAILLAAINDLSKTPEKYAVKPGVDFIRNRKLGFKDYMLMFLTMEADCIREELYRFFGRTIDAPSKAAFYRQRKKIREDAFRNLLLAFNRKLPKKLYNGKYEFWACDGSSCDIFLNPEDKDTYFEPNSKSTRGFNQIHINAMFSLLDKRFTDILVQPARKRNEYSAFCSMVDSADIPEHSKVIFFGDRGYTSDTFCQGCLRTFFAVIQNQTLDFVAHGFSAGLAEMDAHLVGGLADFLYQRGGVLRRSGSGGVCGLHGTGFFAHGAPFSGRGCAVRQNNQSLLRFTRSFAACLVAPAFSSRKFFPAKRIGAHRSRIRS